MRILITGGTGFIGSYLVERWLAAGYQLVVLTRNPQIAQHQWPEVTFVDSINQLKGRFDGLVNLAGAGITEKRWSEQRKRELRRSRVTLTEELVTWAQGTRQNFDWVFSGSAVGYYGSIRPVTEYSAVYTEQSPAGQDFAAQLCQDWERASRGFEHCTSHLVLLRTGIVLGAEGGMLAKLWLPFSLGLGSVLGNGQQVLSWIHISDYCRAIDFIIQARLKGPVNMVAPCPITNRAFTKELAHALSRPALFSAPAFVLRALLGEMSTLLLKGQTVEPAVLQAQGFAFDFQELPAALANIVVRYEQRRAS